MIDISNNTNTISDYLVDLIVLFDHEQKCIVVIPLSNQPGCKHFWEEKIGLQIDKIILPESINGVKQAISQASVNGISEIVTLQTYHDQNQCYSKGKFRGLDKQFLGKKIIGWYQYSSMQSDEQEFQNDLDVFKRVIGGIEVPMFIINPEDETLIAANMGAMSLSETSTQNIIGKKIADIINISPKEVKEIIKSVRKTHTNKLPFNFTTQNGKKLFLEVHVTSVSLHGKEIIIGVFFDLTERNEIQEKLQQNLQLFQTLFDQNTLPILLLDSESLRIAEANGKACDFFGLSPEEIKGVPLANFSDIPKKRFNGILKDFMEKKYSGLELPLKAKNDQKRDIAVHYTQAEIESKNHYLTVLIDVTDRNQALKAVAKVKESLADEVRKQTSTLLDVNNSLLNQIKEREKVEEKLRQSERLFQNLFLINPNGMVLKPAKTGMITEVNHSFLKIFGLTKGKVLLKKLEDLPIHCDTENYLRNYGKLLAEKKVKDVKLTMMTFSGHARFVMYSGEVLNHEKGEYVLEIFHDITDIHIAEQKLAESEETYRTMLNNALVGFYRTEIETGIVLNTNQQYAKILGYQTSNEIIGQSLLQHYIDEHDRDRFINLLKRERIAVYENAILTKQKKMAWVVNYARIYPEKGFLEGVVVDITDRKLMEDMLAFSENKFRNMIENATDIIIIVDSDGNGLYFSPSITKQLGYPINDREKINILDYIEPDDQVIIKKILKGKSKRKTIREVRVRHKNGLTRVFEFTATNLLNEPFVNGIIINAQDITHLIKARNEIDNALKREQELSRQKTQFISTVSHEFRTPLTNISLNVQLLKKYVETGKLERASESLNRMNNATKRLTSLLNEVSLISKDQSGRLQFTPEIIDTHILIDELVDQQSYLFLPYVEVIVKKGERKNVMADATLISHVLGNLVSNAVKYSLSNDKIIVKIEQKVNSLEIYVRDHGIGIPESEIDFLFNPYFRASNVKNIKGTGLGLSIVKKCVELHNGTISISSKEGKGTTVNCNIPMN